MPTPLLLALAACVFGPTPDVTTVTPAIVMPGDALRIEGAQFTDEVEGELIQGTTTVPLPVDVASDTVATTVVPEDLPSGAWTVRMVTAGRSGTPGTVDVWRVETEPACDKRYALKVETSRTRDSVTVERIFRDRPATRDTYEKDAMSGLERTTSTTRDGRACQAVWLRLADGGRVLLVDDTTRDLAQVAAELSSTLGLPLTSAASPSEPTPPDAP